MTALFLAPHNDDETLFGAFTLIRYRPHVVVVLRSHAQEHAHGFQRRPEFLATAEIREEETVRALESLGLDPHGHFQDRPGLEQWPYPDDDADWETISADFKLLAATGRYDRVFAPAVQEGGNAHHNMVGTLALAAFGDRVALTSYMTYVNGRGRDEGVPVPYENEWIGRKLCALAQYESQHRLESTAHHFMQGLHEWYLA